MTGFYLLCGHAVGLAQRGTQQGLEVQVEAHGRLAVKVSCPTNTRHLHQQVLQPRPGVEVPSCPAEDQLVIISQLSVELIIIIINQLSAGLQIHITLSSAYMPSCCSDL